MIKNNLSLQKLCFSDTSNIIERDQKLQYVVLNLYVHTCICMYMFAINDNSGDLISRQQTAMYVKPLASSLRNL